MLLPPHGGEVVTDTDTRRVSILAEHDLVHVTESHYAAGERGPDVHVHRHHADAFYVLEGELVFELGPDSQRLRVGARTLVLAPALLAHSFRNEGPGDARFLNVHAPGRGFAEWLRTKSTSVFDTEDPPADGGRPFEDAIVRGPDEGEELGLGPSGLLFKAEGHDGDGTFSLSETTIEPGFAGAVPHLHERTADSIFVLEGTLRIRLSDDELDAPAGSYAFVPPSVVHTFSNSTDEPARVLNLMAPGGFEQYLKEAVRAAEVAGGSPDPALMAEIASRYDFQPA